MAKLPGQRRVEGEAAHRMPAGRVRGSIGRADRDDGDFGSPDPACYCSCPSVFIDSFVGARSWSRGSVEERPVHTGEVAGSIPAGTTAGFDSHSTTDRAEKPSRAIGFG